METNTLNSIDGATALKLDESYQIEEQELNSSIKNFESQLQEENVTQSMSEKGEQVPNTFPSGVSIESASYMENNNLIEDESDTFLSSNNF